MNGNDNNTPNNPNPAGNGNANRPQDPNPFMSFAQRNNQGERTGFYPPRPAAPAPNPQAAQMPRRDVTQIPRPQPQPNPGYHAAKAPAPDAVPKPDASATANTVKAGKKAKKPKQPNANGTAGFKVFVVISLVMSILSFILCFFSPQLEKILNNIPMEHVPGTDNTQLQINEAIEGSVHSIQIAEAAEKINVGIMIYGKSQSFFSDSKTSLLGTGSGIIMSEDESGTYTYIITCAHVISDGASSGNSMTVQDSDGNTYDGIMVGYDVKTDIGVIKIAATGLTAANFGDSSSLKKGQNVYAIGNPGGMDFFGSFTEGMISSIDRPISSEGGYEMKCIQHTTPINSGNSGGALLNEAGQVIGINSSKIVSTGYEGMAFSIPISDAKPIIDDLIANGQVTNRPKLGISFTVAMQHQSYAMIINQNNLPAGSLVIRDINPDSSLASTDAEVYDLIIAVNGEDLDTSDVLLDKIENGKVGDKLTLTLCRVDPDDYSITKFDVEVKLVADTGK